ncbi:hypothetical protein [Jatrophihabitans sp.]|uniref:hypothetical protein n=1 Tax=Jatrophihabitans sp. TaxID=1932789 RepID=UPI0030C72C70|nr:hypothetical protein [Jatrophihabitans sp.]
MTNPRPGEDELALGAIDAIDLAVLDRIEALYRQLDPVPAALVERVQFGITLEALHSEIAELQRSADLAGVRSDGGADAQTITFTSARLTTMVTISPISAELARIDGWVVPGAGVTVELRTVGGVSTTTTDPDGRFVFEAAERGIAQFILRQASDASATVVTPSVEL